MARLSASGMAGKPSFAHDRKSNSARDKRAAKFTEDHQRKLSMDAYYRPRQRGLINVDSWEEDEMEADVMPCN